MTKRLNCLKPITIFFLALTAFFLFSPSVYANNFGNNHGDDDGRDHHSLPTIPPTPTPDRHDHHDHDDGHDHDADKCSPTPKPTQTPIPTVPPEFTPTPLPTVPSEITSTPAPTGSPSTDNGGGGSSGGGGNPGPPVCNASDPGVPTNLRVTALGGGQVRLNWNAAPGSVSTYAVAYGPSAGNYLYGDPNVGNVTVYTVKALTPGGKYCFYVQAQNDCRGGSPSNVVCTNQGVGSPQVLGASTNFNPIITGLEDSYGGSVLGAATELFNTAEVVYSDSKLPSGNQPDPGHTLSIPAIGLNQSVSLPQLIGDMYTVGQDEVLYTRIKNTPVYYGHNGTDVFGRLFQLHLHDKIIIGQNGASKTYQIDKILFVSRDQIDQITSDNSDDIVLTTCSFTQPDFRIIIKASEIK